MLTETTVSKLREMRLSVMANALKDQHADPQFQSMAFEDRLGLLVDAEWNARKNNHLNKLIRQATFSDPGACLENVEYLPDRGLKQEELLRFGTCNYIQEHHNIILLGATGSGKTYLACALGMLLRTPCPSHRRSCTAEPGQEHSYPARSCQSRHPSCPSHAAFSRCKLQNAISTASL